MGDGDVSLKWRLDSATCRAAKRHPFGITSTDALPQFQGFNVNPAIWNRRVIAPAKWPASPLKSSPGQIIACFGAEHYLEALALVVSWGAMGRTAKYIYGDRSLPAIREALRASARSVRETTSIAGAWNRLVGEGDGKLGWTPVMASKTLHFLCRALGFVRNPPVPIDNAMILDKVWPAWKAILPGDELPGDWRGKTLAAYERYMTAIAVWADARGWTTTDTEATIFAEQTMG